MADKKISALTAATTPLAGTEVLPIVQGGSTVQVSIANVTAGRAVAATDIVASGEITSTTNNARLSLYRSAGTNYFDWASGQTLAFGTQTSQGGAGRVSKVNFLDSGDLTNVTGNFVIGTAGKGIDFSANGGDVLKQYDEGTFTPVFNNLTVGNGSVSGRYTRIGRMVTATIQMEFGSTSAWTGTCANISGLPFTSLYRANGLITLFRTGVAWFAGQVMIYANQNQTSFPGDANGAAFSATTPWTWGAGDFVVITLTYEV